MALGSCCKARGFSVLHLIYKPTAVFLERKVNPTRVPIEGKESMRWLANLRQSTELLGQLSRCIHIADREGDIWELFCLARELDTHFADTLCRSREPGAMRRSVSLPAASRSAGPTISPVAGPGFPTVSPYAAQGSSTRGQ